MSGCLSRTIHCTALILTSSPNCPNQGPRLSGANFACRPRRFLCLISSFLFHKKHAGRPSSFLTLRIIMQPTTLQQTPFPRRRNTPSNLGIKITPPANLPNILVAEVDTSSSPGPSFESGSVLPPCSPTKPRSLRNIKRLSLTLQTNPSSNSLIAAQDQCQVPPSPAPGPRRRPSVVSLPAATTHLRQREDNSPSIPYVDGPIEILPGVWLGSEDSARDWRGLVKRGIKSILNVAKEVTCPIDASTSRPLRPAVSTSDLSAEPQDSKPIYFPAHIPSSRPGFHYLRLPWSHGQPDLVGVGFPAAFDFVDKSIARGDGILIQ